MLPRIRAAMPHQLDGAEPTAADLPAYIKRVEDLETELRAWGLHCTCSASRQPDEKGCHRPEEALDVEAEIASRPSHGIEWTGTTEDYRWWIGDHREFSGIASTYEQAWQRVRETIERYWS